MRTKEDLIKRYNVLYDDMCTSKDPKKMMVFGESEKWIFCSLAEKNPDMAENWLSHLEAAHWKNYLSERESSNIGKRMINQDGSRNFHWNYDTLSKTVRKLDGKMEDCPYYNEYALFVAMNMVYSDHANSIAMDMGYKNPQEVHAEDMALSCYRKAVELLKDTDGGFSIRKYFKGKMYDDSPMS